MVYNKSFAIIGEEVVRLRYAMISKLCERLWITSSMPTRTFVESSVRRCVRSGEGVRIFVRRGPMRLMKDKKNASEEDRGPLRYLYRLE
jgi:hypothetical protein